MTNDNSYLREFQACVLTLDNLNANILSKIPFLLKDEVERMYFKTMEAASEEELKSTKKSFERKNAGRLLLIGADHQRYGNMKSNMQLNMAMGTNNYPDLLEDAINIMNTHQQS